MLLPPSLPLILFAMVAEVPMEELFLAALLPALVMAGCLAVYAARHAVGNTAVHVDAGEPAALWAAKWELLLPVVAFIALFGGFATPVEAAALTATYAFVVAVWCAANCTSCAMFRGSWPSAACWSAACC